MHRALSHFAHRDAVETAPAALKLASRRGGAVRRSAHRIPRRRRVLWRIPVSAPAPRRPQTASFTRSAPDLNRSDAQDLCPAQGGLQRRPRKTTEDRQRPQNPQQIKGLKRRGRDSNPRWTKPPIPVFETGAFNRSATSPGGRRKLSAMCAPDPGAQRRGAKNAAQADRRSPRPAGRPRPGGGG